MFHCACMRRLRRSYSQHPSALSHIHTSTMQIVSLLQRLFALGAAFLILLQVPLLSAYGRKSGFNEIRIAPASYFVHAAESTEFVKSSHRLKGMVSDVGVFFHAPYFLADEAGIASPIFKSLDTKPVVTKKHKRGSSFSTKEAMRKSRRWKKVTTDVGRIAKYDLVGLAASAVIMITAFLALFFPSAAQYVLLWLATLVISVMRSSHSHPNLNITVGFYYIVGMLLMSCICAMARGD